MRSRTSQDLLAERRATIRELSGETDATVRGVLQYAIDEIDIELRRRRPQIIVLP